MDNKKFEQLITLITNENEEQARALFHDIVVEKSREIYESMMDEEEGMGGQVGDLLDEINAEEQGMTEEDDDLDDLGGDEEGEEVSLDGDDEFGGEEGADEFGGGEEGLEDRVVSLEDKLDELMAEFEEIMNGGEEGGEDLSGEEGDGSIEGGEEGADDFGGEEEGEEEPMMEATSLTAVKGLYGSKIGGDDGVQTKSPALSSPKINSSGAKPLSLGGGETGGKGGTQGGLLNPTPKVIPGSYKNAAGQKNADQEAAPKPKTSQEAGVNNKSTLGENRKRK